MGIIDYKLVWQNLDAAIEQQLIDFWLAEGAMEEEKEARARLPYVAAIATDEEGLVGVASMQPAHSERLKRQMYFFRTFVGAEARGKGVATQLIHTVYDGFNAAFTSGRDTNCIGVVMLVHNSAVALRQNAAIWEKTKFVYIGKNSQGAPMRVRYFDNASIV